MSKGIIREKGGHTPQWKTKTTKPDAQPTKTDTTKATKKDTKKDSTKAWKKANTKPTTPKYNF